MKIGFIGAGKVGYSLGKYFSGHGLNITGYYSLHPDSAKEAAIFTNSNHYNDLETVIYDSDVIFLTVPDGIIGNVYNDVSRYDISGKTFVHCSGALSSNIFIDISNKGAFGCSLHPICAISSKLTGYKDLSNAYFTIEGTNTGNISDLLDLCGNTYEIISAQNKVKYHACAVFTSNLVVSLYDIATKLLRDCGLSEDFSNNALKSLFIGNAQNIVIYGLTDALTGPVERADISTIKKHLDSLTGDEKVMYRLLSKNLISVAKQKNPDRDYESLIDLLNNNII